MKLVWDYNYDLNGYVSSVQHHLTTITKEVPGLEDNTTLKAISTFAIETW